MSTAPQIPTPPAAPNKYGGDPVAFDASMQAYLDWQTTAVAQQNAQATWLNQRADTVDAGAAAAGSIGASVSTAAASAAAAAAARDAALAAWVAAATPTEQLSAISQSLHSGAIVKAIVYQTDRDSDGGAWRKRCQHTSWYTEALGFTGKWLGQKTNLAAAWATSGAAAGDGYQNVTDGKYYVLTGTNTHSEIFRGNVREFPAVVAVVAESARVVIYDLTQPTCPMWIVAMSTAGTYPLTSVAAAQGQVWSGRNNAAGGILGKDFVSATSYCYKSTGKATGVFGDKDVPSSLAVFSGTGIVNNVVNDVAITVLDTAPIDAATGLPVPTIGVATAGGVSVIKDDGTVVNDTYTPGGTLEANHIKFVGSGYMWASRALAGTQYFYCIKRNSIPSASTSAVADALYRSSLSANGTPSLALLGTGATSAVEAKAIGSSTGLNVLKENPATPTKGMVDYITNTYNSGWMVGDIRGAWLADTTAETISGSGELVTNGTFATDTSGWTASNATLAVVGGQLQITNTASNGYAYQAITTVVGRSYAISVDCVSKTTGSFGVFAGTTPTNGNLAANQAISVAGTYVLSFVAASTTTYIDVQAFATAGAVAVFDNISVKLAEPDRCVKNKGLIVNGSLTKAAVAAGAGLVAWSGFSASNYLEQPYRSDLDFGTGDFCAMGWVDAATVGTSQYIFSRGAASNPTLALYHTTAGVGLICSGTATATPNLVAIAAGIHHLAMVRESGVLKLYFDNVLVYSAANTENITNTAAQLMFGVAYDGSTPYLGKLALWRISASAPSADQIAHIYRTELPLFQANAQCTLAGTSTAVTTMAYDEDTALLHVGTSWGRSTFKDLTRVDSEATTTGALTSLSASGGVIVTGGTSGKVYMPALLLRDELRRKAEARKALGRVPVFFDSTATASQTAFVAPKGYTIKALYHNGTLKREATTGVYWTRSNDGFQETATLSVGASASDWISLMCVRA